MDAIYDLVSGNWGTTVAAAATRDRLYVIDEDTHLYRVDPRTGARVDIIDRGWHAQHLVATGDHLYAFEPTGNVYKIALADQSVVQLGETWRDVRATTSLGNRVFAIEGRTMYELDRETGVGKPLATNGFDTRKLVGLGDSLYAWERDNNLYRVDPASGRARLLDGTWPLIMGAATACGQLFAVDDTILYQVDPETGACARRGDRYNTRLFAGGGAVLFSFERSGELFRISVG